MVLGLDVGRSPLVQGRLLNGWGVFFQDDVCISVLEMVVIQYCECTKCHKIVHFKAVSFMLCEFLLIKGQSHSIGKAWAALTAAEMDAKAFRRFPYAAFRVSVSCPPRAKCRSWQCQRAQSNEASQSLSLWQSSLICPASISCPLLGHSNEVGLGS